jgi:hypothetical protein
MICFIALYVLRIIQNKVKSFLGLEDTTSYEYGISETKIQEALKNFECDQLNDLYYKVSKIEGDIKLILNAYGIYEDLRIPDKRDLNSFKKRVKNLYENFVAK